jgi:hypothetical protein
MLSPFELVIYGFLTLVLLPIVVWSLLRGSPAPPGAMGKYYAVEPYLNVTGNVLVLVLCVSAVLKLVAHFRYIDPDLGTRLTEWIGVPLAILVLAFLTLWVRAILKVRRSGKTG